MVVSRTFLSVVPLLLSIALVYGPCRAQTKAPDVLTIDIGSAVLSSEKGLPFDVAFQLVGQLDAQDKIKKIGLEYQIDKAYYESLPSKGLRKRTQARYYFPGSSSLTQAVFWDRISPEHTKFALPVGPLHPNVRYTFKFSIYRDIDITQAERDKLNANLLKILRNAFAKLEDVDATYLKSYEAELQNQIQLTLASTAKLIDKKSDSEYVASMYAPPLEEVTNRIIRLHNDSLDAPKGSKQNALRELLEKVFSQDKVPAHNAIALKLINQSASFTDIAKKVLALPLNPAIEEYKTVTPQEMASWMLNALAKGHISEILKGKSKIAGNAIESNTGLHVPSLRLLQAFYQTVASDLMRDNSLAAQRVFATHSDLINNTSAQLKAAIDAELILIQSKTSFDNLLKGFPDVFTNKVLLESRFKYDQSIEDLKSNANPYVGLDFGFVYSHYWQSVFLYQGANIYFTPVNKDTPLADYQRRDQFFKRFSVFFGLTQNLIESKSETYRALIPSLSSSLLLGAGYRITKVVRFNLSGMCFNEVSANPLEGDEVTRTKIRPAVSVSFDINIANALGALATRLGINP